MAKKTSEPSSPGVFQNPLGDPQAWRGYSTDLKKMAQGEKKSDFLPSFGNSVGSFVSELLKIVIVALIIIIPVRYFILQPFYVKGASMEPNFHDNEYLIIDELSYRFHTPRRGDVTVLRNPQLLSEFFIKRIIGLPNEQLEVSDGRVIITNASHPGGAVLDESAYLPAGRETSGSVEVTIGPKEYFVMGDNRPASLDSRSFGPIEESGIVGRTAVRAWPLHRLATFQTPSIPLRSPGR